MVHRARAMDAPLPSRVFSLEQLIYVYNKVQPHSYGPSVIRVEQFGKMYNVIALWQK